MTPEPRHPASHPREPAPAVRRVPPRDGYDVWSDTYDATPNPVVAMDVRHTPAALAPRAGERILDAGTGTGRHLAAMRAGGARVVGVDFSLGMMRVAHRAHPEVPLAAADLQRALPFRDATFDAALCALVGEHLDQLDATFAELHRVLRPRARVVFSVYHPAMALAGVEANFEREGIEYRLGAETHAVADYVSAMTRAGFAAITVAELAGDEALMEMLPKAAKYLGFPVLLVLQGLKR